MTDKIIFMCGNIGIVGTTAVHVKKHESGIFEARCGFSLMGETNMTSEEFAACGNDPFNENFFDNYAIGKGDNQEQAITQLKANMKACADSLWV